MAYYEMFINRKKTKKNKGPFIFYEVGGSPQKNGLKGGAIPKKTEGRGGSREIF